MKAKARTFTLALLLQAGCALPALAAPMAVLDRNGAAVSIEPYAPNIVRVTLATDPDTARSGPGKAPMPSPMPPVGLTSARTGRTCSVRAIWKCASMRSPGPARRR
jgi:hypothetical protein